MKRLIIRVVIGMAIGIPVGIGLVWLTGGHDVSDLIDWEKEIKIMNTRDYLWFAANIADENEDHQSAIYLYHALNVLVGAPASFSDPNVQYRYLIYKLKIGQKRGEAMMKVMSEN